MNIWCKVHIARGSVHVCIRERGEALWNSSYVSLLENSPPRLHNLRLVQWSLLDFTWKLLWNERLHKHNPHPGRMAGGVGKTHVTPPCPHGCDIPAHIVQDCRLVSATCCEVGEQLVFSLAGNFC